MSRPTAAPAAFLDPNVLARIDNLDLLARIVVDGFVSGLHRSPYMGVSTDFAEHRAYMPGDDIRRVDWRVYARTDRFYIKQFEAETNADVGFLFDMSASMSYGSGDVSKLDYARFLAASLAYFSARQRDRVGLYAFDDDVTEYVRPSSAHLDKILHALARVEATRKGRWDEPLARVANTFRRRGILAVISDFYDDPEEIAATLGSLKAQGHDMVAFHVLDPAEIDFPFGQAANFQDLETTEVLPVVPEKLAGAYRSQVAEHIETLRKLFGRRQIDYVLLNTADPLDQALYTYLVFRQKTMKVR